ncbi:hypothetical protein LCGC14_2909690, partial [marine sediment metagenome]
MLGLGPGPTRDGLRLADDLNCNLWSWRY